MNQDGTFDMRTTIEQPDTAVELYLLDTATGTQLFVLLPAPHFLRVYDVAVIPNSETMQVTPGEHPVVASFNDAASAAQLEIKQWLPFAELDAPEQGTTKLLREKQLRNGLTSHCVLL